MSEFHRILITGGGTGGHIFPGLAVADWLRQHGVEVHWLGTRRGMESTLVPAAGVPITYLRVSGIRGKGRLQQLLAPFILVIAVLHALYLMRRLKPTCVLGTGGFVAGPGGLAAWLSGRPLILHEQNAVAGTTNRLLARFARRVLVGIPGAFDDRVGAEFIGNPVRAAITALPEHVITAAPAPLRVLVIGGSQGARILNQTLPDALALIAAEHRPLVRHQAGRAEYEATKARYHALGVNAQVELFIDDMVAAYRDADLVICRAGALTVSELAAAGLPSILVPLPTAIDDHQRKNAEWLSKSGAAKICLQADFSAESLAHVLTGLMTDRDTLVGMASAARKQARPNAAAVVGGACMEAPR